MVSVIVPVYNAAGFIDSCIRSILNQEEGNFEILLIDDGSTDGSGEKCDSWSTKDARIRVFHKRNGGVSSARNVGLDNARGEWIAFIDADDEVSPQYLSIPGDFHDADIVVKGFIERFRDHEISYGVTPFDISGVKSINKWFIQRRNNALWDKLIRRKAIGNRRFDTSIRIGEDLLFVATILPNVNRIVSWGIGRYFYIRRETSAMSNTAGKNRIESDIIISERLMDLYRKDSNKKHCIAASAQVISTVRHNFCALNADQIYRLRLLCSQINIFTIHFLTIKDRVKFLLISSKLKRHKI